MPDEPTDQPPVVAPPILQQPINGQKSGLSIHGKRVKTAIWRISAIVAVILVGSVVAVCLWYAAQLKPLTADSKHFITVTVTQNSTTAQIGQLLQDKSIIRSSTAFDINARLSGNSGKLKPGTYRLSPSQSTSQIIDHLVSGKVDQFNIMFLPGATLKQHRQVLIEAGFTAAEVDKAFAETYDSPLFDGKPTGTDLEGYIYGETYNVNASDSVEQILKRTFAEFSDVVVKNNLVEGFKQQGLTLYEGITLASIVQRESITPPDTSKPSADQKQIAQVFYSRLAAGMTLGSDVTYQYAADKLGVARDVNLDSPYNTRRYKGLPPGPIASPGLTALKAVAAPAAGDYLFFLTGDDNITYFAHTDAEHKANIINHCAKNCNTP